MNVDVTVVVTAVIALIGYCVTVFLYIHSRLAAVSEKIDLKIEASKEATSKGMHGLRNEVQLEVGKHDVRLTTLERETVREKDLGRLEERLNAQLNKIEVNLKDFCNVITKEVNEVSKGVVRLEARRDMSLDQEGEKTAWKK